MSDQSVANGIAEQNWQAVFVCLSAQVFWARAEPSPSRAQALSVEP